MRKWGFLLLAVLLAIALTFRIWHKNRAAVAPPAPVSEHSADPPTVAESPNALKFTRDGIPGKMADEVEHVVRPRQAAAALCDTPNGRFACILVEGPGDEKYFELDADLAASDFAFLAEQSFVTPPFQVSRSMSTFRSVAKSAMDYHAERGDRMLVLICPKKMWDSLSVLCPDSFVKR